MASGNPEHVIELKIPSEFGYEKIAMAVAATVAQRMGFPPERIEDLKTAVAEATINAIEHGNQEQAAMTIVVHLNVTDDALEVDVQDSGGGMPVAREEATLEDRLEGRAPSRGWGLFLIQNLVDEVMFRADADGHWVRLIVKLPRSEHRGMRHEA